MRLEFGIFVGLLCLTIGSAELQPSQCGTKKPILLVKNFQIDNCTEFPCVLTRGTNASLNMELTATQRITGLKLAVFGIIGGLEVPFNMNSNEHCKAAINDEACPLQKGKAYQYTNGIHVSPQYPAISVSVRYQLNDLAGKQLLCIQFPAKLV